MIARPNWLCLAALSLAACTGPPGRPGGAALADRADISGVVAADLAFARLAREKGQWHAFLETMADGAIMFAPHVVGAREWVSQKHELPQAAEWRPNRVISSCDGTLAASLGGATSPDGSFSRYVIIWQRQRDGSYRWLLDTGDPVTEPLETPEMIASTVADCDIPPSGATAGESTRVVASRDGTLRYELTPGSGEQSGELVALYWTGERFEPFYRRSVPPAPGMAP